MPPDQSPPSTATQAKAAAVKSPFFRPSDSSNGRGRIFRTPGGTTRRKPDTTTTSSSDKEEHKSTVLGCSSNLVNAIVGSGIVGLPFAIQESGFVPGILLVVFCAGLTETSLRLLVETAKHAGVPSYETLAEAAYGSLGFYFVATNMLILAYGAMLSYLMIVKDTFSSLLGIADGDVYSKRAVLVLVSSLVILPLSCQRDMADLARTSKMNVGFDLIMVLVVAYLALHRDDYGEYEYGEDSGAFHVQYYSMDDPKERDWADVWRVRWGTIFVGLGVLSFAFVCQHSAFIIAGSLENPTRERWSRVTKLALGFACGLALLMGISGYLGFGAREGGVQGNILKSLPETSRLAKIAQGLLGTTMLFVYPMESFVARHACVVLLFQGRRAHEGDDASVLTRRDRRITLTVALYLSAVVPAALFEKLGAVLAVTGAVGGSCMSYIGPGIVYLGIHGEQFLELSRLYFDRDVFSNTNHTAEAIPLVHKNHSKSSNGGGSETKAGGTIFRLCQFVLKTVPWYLLGMPIWTALASIGKGSLRTYETEMAMKSPHPLRIGNVRHTSGNSSAPPVLVLEDPPTNKNLAGAFADASGNDDVSATRLLRADSLPKQLVQNNTTHANTVVGLPPRSFLPPKKPRKSNRGNGPVGTQPVLATKYQSIHPPAGGGDDIAIEDDPREIHQVLWILPLRFSTLRLVSSPCWRG